MDKELRILVVSGTPWNNSNSFGNTFTNLFQGMKGVKIYNICCSNGKCNNPVTEKVYQMTVNAVCKSIYRRNVKTGWVVNGDVDGEYNSEMTIARKMRQRRRIFAIILKDLLWKLGRWKKSKELKSFIAEANPDILYFPFYASWSMCDVQRYVIKRCNVPLVGHISDDLYSYPKGFFYPPLFGFYRLITRRKIRQLMKSTSYIDVFAQNMKEEYEKIFKKPCFLIGKGVKTNNLPEIQKGNFCQEPVKFVYTGNIGGERFKVLYYIGKAIDKLLNVKKAQLIIYSATPLSREMERKFSECSCIDFKGSVSGEDIPKIQQQADFLVHVESFSKKAIFETKMSLSTKIIDYMCVGKPIFAVGPREVNSLSLLSDYGLAITANTINEIEEKLREIYLEKLDVFQFQKNAYKYLINERNIEKIQKEIYERLVGLTVNKDESTTN